MAWTAKFSSKFLIFPLKSSLKSGNFLSSYFCKATVAEVGGTGFAVAHERITHILKTLFASCRFASVLFTHPTLWTETPLTRGARLDCYGCDSTSIARHWNKVPVKSLFPNKSYRLFSSTK